MRHKRLQTPDKCWHNWMPSTIGPSYQQCTSCGQTSRYLLNEETTAMRDNMRDNMNTNNPGDLDSILDADPETLMSDPEPEWKNPEEMLYQAIMVTRANLKARFDERKNRATERAYCNFYFLDDPSQQPYAFSTGWLSLRNQVRRMIALNTFPAPCGVVEMREAKAFVDDQGQTHYPLQFARVDRLEELAAFANDLATSAPPAPVAEPPEPSTQRAPAQQPRQQWQKGR